MKAHTKKRAKSRRDRANLYGQAPAGKPTAESFLRALSEQYRSRTPARAAEARAILKIDGLTSQKFFEHYYYANRPVILRGLMRGWRALKLWTPDYFAERFGKYEIEIAGERDRDPEYESNFDGHRRKMRMSDFVSMMQERGATNDFYISAKNFLLRRKGFESLRKDFRCPREFLDPRKFRTDGNIFFGPKGTVTPLHFDGCNILLGQIYGRKRVKLIPPFDMENVYAERYCFSAVDMEDMRWKKFPRMRRATVMEAVLEPGEFLFIPMGWYHWVKALDISISLSMIHFRTNGGLTQWRFWE